MFEHKHVVVFYHGCCIDGASAAWAAREALKDQPDIEVSFVPLGNGDPQVQKDLILSKIKDGSDVYFLDVSPKDPALAALFAPHSEPGWPHLARLTIIDHHPSEVARLQAFVAAHPELSQTGPIRLLLDAKSPAAALQSWAFFHPNKPAPALLRWVGKMENSASLVSREDLATASFIDSFDITTPESAFQSVAELIATDPKDMVLNGNAILADQMNNARKSRHESLLYTELEVLAGKRLWIPILNLNVKNFGRLVDRSLIDAAREITVGKYRPMLLAAAWTLDGNGLVQMSLRTEGALDASLVAKHLTETIAMGGGGKGRAACVQFASLMDFCTKVPLVTKAQMLAMRETCPSVASSCPRPLPQPSHKPAARRFVVG